MKELILITGASQNHHKSMIQLLHSFAKFETNSRVIVFDLGLGNCLSKINEALKSLPNSELRRFPYEQYPSYFNIHVNAGEYAWKPVIIYSIMEETKGLVFWLDAGCLIHKKLTEVRKVLEDCGVYTPVSSGRILRWAHPKTLERMNVCDNILNYPNRSGGVFGVNYANPVARKLMIRWRNHCTQKTIVAPLGSSRRNHRQDQTVLSILIAQFIERGWLKKEIPRGYLDLSVHHDVD